MNKAIIALLLVCITLVAAAVPPPCPTKGTSVYLCETLNQCVTAEECASFGLKREGKK